MYIRDLDCNKCALPAACWPTARLPTCPLLRATLPPVRLRPLCAPLVAASPRLVRASGQCLCLQCGLCLRERSREFVPLRAPSPRGTACRLLTSRLLQPCGKEDQRLCLNSPIRCRTMIRVSRSCHLKQYQRLHRRLKYERRR